MSNLGIATHGGADVHQGGTIGDMIISAIGRFPDRVAFVDGDRSLTYTQLGVQIGKAMAAFQQLGLKRGDGVMQLAGNRVEVFVVMAAAYLLGLRSVTLHSMGGYDDHAYIIQDAEPLVFISEKEHWARATELRAGCKAVPHWFSHGECEGFNDFWALADSLPPQPLVSHAGAADVIRLAYTGGTTGKPKGVMLANRCVWMQAVLLMAARGLPPGCRVLSPTPISHGAGAMIVPTLALGGMFVLQRGFDPEKFIDAVEKHRIGSAFLVPTMIYKLLDHPRCATADFSSLKMLSYGASPMTPARIREAIARLGPVLFQSYGQTECPSNILHLTSEDHCRTDVDTLASAGMPYPGVTVALLDENDQPVGTGEVGEICVRSPLVMDGYWKQPEQTAQALRNGWLHTGDMARRDAHGYYYLVDRRKDMIISGGFNVYPKEVEDVIAHHPAIAAVAVIGVPDEKWGEAVKAIAVKRSAASVDAEELRDLVRRAKGSVCTPKTVEFVDALPLTALGKPDKKALRTRYWGGQERAIH
ncbi:fatty-acid--CoA ligase FadD8 [Ramlibacter monticola]|uniref:AMP-binding protein n=1 Tax=Ramlibacter monticola TaxID=1926872 RepID=A0A936YY95_9BURK|nr:AMP-binding protein [Ramlibacter monticola]MBL0390145.1 AMP-binding protein [Ramlibacter monticola]